MKKYLVMFLVAFMFVVGVAYYSSSRVGAEEALVIKDGTCALFDADGHLFFTNQTQQVDTDSKNNNSKISCHAQQPATVALPAKAVHFNYENTGLLCSTGFGLTQNWKAVVTPDGNSMLSCHYKQ